MRLYVYDAVMSDVTAAIVGLGYWGPNLLRNFGAAKGCRIKYGCDLQQSNLDRLKDQYPAVVFTTDTQDVLDDPEVDLMLIATPAATHFLLAKQALEKGKHVFVEKPMTSRADEAVELEKIAAATGKTIFVDHTFVFAPAVQKMADLVQDGTLGKLLYFDSDRINLGLIQKDTNVFWDLAVHDLSILNVFQDLADVTKVSAHGNAYFGEQPEVGHLHLSFKSGFMAHIHVSWLAPVKIRHTILAGTKSMITYDDTEPSEKLRVYDKGVDRDETRSDPFFPKYRAGDALIPALSGRETLAIEAEHIIECIMKNKKPLVGAAEGRKIVQVLAAADESLRTGQSAPLSV